MNREKGQVLLLWIATPSTRARNRSIRYNLSSQTKQLESCVNFAKTKKKLFKKIIKMVLGLEA